MEYELCIRDKKVISCVYPNTDTRLWIDLVIPNEVCEIGDGAFYLSQTRNNKCNKNIILKKITFPNTLQHIGKFAFYDSMEYVCSLKLPTKLVSIGDSAFQGKDGAKVRSLTIPNKVTSIGQDAFHGWKFSLTKIKLGKGLETIGEGAFAHCFSVEQLEGKFVEGNTIVVNGTLIAVFGARRAFKIPDSVTNIGNWSFSSCAIDIRAFRDTSLGPEEIVLHEGVKRIGDYAFFNTRLKQLHIPESVETIGTNPILNTPCELVDGKFTFENRAIVCGNRLCAHIKKAESYAIPDGITELGVDAFNQIIFYFDLVLPESVKHIGKRCFYSSGLCSIALNEGLESIDDEAFCYCKKLTSIVFPSTLRQMGNFVLADSELLRTITFLGTVPPKIIGSLMGDSEMEHSFKGVVKVPAESLEAYRALFPRLSEPTPTHPNGRILTL